MNHLKYYIGISSYYHESSVALCDNNAIKCFLKEEWFTRIKGDKNFPKNCIKFLIEKFNISDENIKFVCFYEKPFRNWWEIFYYSIKRPFKNRELLIHHIKNFSKSSIFFFSDFSKLININKKKIIYSQHHLSHCLYGSTIVKDRSEYVFVTCDGVGEGETMAIYSIEKDNTIKKLWSNSYPNSIGLFYSMITDYIGFEINEGEFKTMSLSSYGKPIYINELKKIFDINSFKINMAFFDFHAKIERSFSNKFIKIFGDPYLELNSKENFNKYANIAASAQQILEFTIKNLLLKAINLSGKKKIILTGGVALNCKMINSLSKLNIFKELIVPPSPGDSGSAIGACNFAYLYDNKLEQLNLKSIFPGPNRKIINKNLNINSNELFKNLSNNTSAYIKAAEKIVEGEVIATYLENSETGPRSLGNTSILCDASNKETVENLNLNLKKRDFFQPLAPIILEEDFNNYFLVNKNVYKNLEWMGTICEAKQELYNKYKPVIHVDGTCRTQIIKDNNLLVYKILKYLKKFNCSILVNTSFNISKDPTVFDLFDVYVNMKRMNIKFVLMDDGLYETKDL